VKSARVILLALVLIALLPLGTGCSSFRRDKKSAAQAHPVAGSIEGLWVGRWYSSQKPSHGGKMEMVLTKTGDTLYRASTRSHWWGLFRSSYDTPLVVTPVRAGEFMILGEKQLWGFGGYTVTGRVDTARMDAGFWVGSNHGRIELQRASVTNAP
jgi:hypothetical protein